MYAFPVFRSVDGCLAFYKWSMNFMKDDELKLPREPLVTFDRELKTLTLYLEA